VSTGSEGPGLAASGVAFAYGERLAVRGASLGLNPGEAVSLAGPNGSGKSTLLRLLSGALRPRAGEVRLDGKLLRDLSPREVARRVAVLSQHLDPRLMFPVHQLVAMGRTPYAGPLASPTTDDRLAVERALEATGTEDLASRRFSELSGGEQQRVMLAMALAQETDYLLLDEPTVHLDLYHQHELLELLAALQAERRMGILAVMHDLNLAALYFRRTVLMEGGQVIADGPSDAIIGDRACLGAFRVPLAVVRHPQSGVPQVLLERGRPGVTE
jgi:iron complex transport system ATP-binding protein